MDRRGVVAYFSPEFGLDEGLPQYAGGLGVLAGDHLKAAADLGVPVVGVGLFYREGYFRQRVSRTGRQEAVFVSRDPASLGLDLVGEGAVAVGKHDERFRVWRHDVGSVPLYLLQHEEIADRLYGGDHEHRLRQEILLGMGGVVALDVAGVEPRVFHLNEGHAGFSMLERIRRHVEATGATLAEAVGALAPTTVFTTHTPVPAGIDRFSAEMMEAYFSRWCRDVGAGIDELLDLGAMPGDDPHVFNMAAFCLRVAGAANGVSKLHGEVSRRMFAPLWPERPDVPIGHVTNGVHAPTWTAPEIAGLFRRAVGDGWVTAPASAWEGVESIDDAEIRAARKAGKERLASVVAARSTRGATLDPEALVIGFARRFATYKRAALLVDDRDRLARLLTGDGRPVQLLFAGKAHPADLQGQDVLARVTAAAADEELGGRVVFLADYDMAVGRALVQGCDVWLNTPIRGLEASGTSGEKAALNGGLHCSVLDGWWDEMYDGENGWGIEGSEGGVPHGHRPADVADAAATFEVLEEEVVPLFFADGNGPVPSAAWLAKVRHAWRTLGPRVGAARMVADYVERYYRPASGG